MPSITPSPNYKRTVTGTVSGPELQFLMIRVNDPTIGTWEEETQYQESNYDVYITRSQGAVSKIVDTIGRFAEICYIGRPTFDYPGEGQSIVQLVIAVNANTAPWEAEDYPVPNDDRDWDLLRTAIGDEFPENYGIDVYLGLPNGWGFSFD